MKLKTNRHIGSMICESETNYSSAAESSFMHMELIEDLKLDVCWLLRILSDQTQEDTRICDVMG